MDSVLRSVLLLGFMVLFFSAVQGGLLLAVLFKVDDVLKRLTSPKTTDDSGSDDIS